MSYLTTTVRNIMMENIHPDESLLDIDDVYAVGMRCIFDKAEKPLALISQEYRQFFCTSFLNRFMNDEIAGDTIGTWKQMLNAALLENAALVNAEFANLDKVVYTRYAVRRVERSDSHNVSKTSNGTDEARDVETGTEEAETSETNSNQRTLDTVSTVRDSGTVNNAKSGSDSRQVTEDATVTDSGTVNNAKSGSDEVESSGSDVRTIAEDVTDEHTGGNTTTNQDSESSSSSDSSTDKNNAIRIDYDTPQGSLANMRTPGGDATGQGVAYAAAQTYNYMSAAQEDNSTLAKAGQSSNSSSSSGTSEIEYDESNVTDRDSTDTMAYGKVDTSTYNSANLETRNLSNVTDRETTDETLYNSANLETRNLTNVKEDDGTISDSGAKSSTSEASKSNTKTHTGENETSEAEEGASEGLENEINYEITSEMLLNAQSIVKKILDLFDLALFSQILA